MTNLSAPDLSNFLPSSKDLIPPPAAIGTKHSQESFFNIEENLSIDLLFLETSNTISSSIKNAM